MDNLAEAESLTSAQKERAEEKKRKKMMRSVGALVMASFTVFIDWAGAVGVHCKDRPFRW